MREFSVTGNLGADAEVLTDKNGSNYLRFRLANHEFGDSENETRWFDVTMFNIPRISQYLKKGTGVRVIGDYKDSVYQSEKYGALINRNITAFKVDFWNGGKREEGEQQSQTKSTEETPAKVETEAPKAEKTAKTAAAHVAPASSVVMPEGSDDELPF